MIVDELTCKAKEDFEGDEGLVEAFQNGDMGAFDRLVLRHKDRVFNICYRLLGDYEEANDSAQEVFIKIYRSLGRFRFGSKFSTWLYRITVNTCINKLKSLRFRLKARTLSLSSFHDPEDGDMTIELKDDSELPDKHFEKKQNKILIQEEINALPVPQRTLIVLRHIEGLSYDEIADITGYNIGTVKSRLARARLRLKERLKGVI